MQYNITLHMKTLLLALTLMVTTTSFTPQQLHYVYIDTEAKAGYYHADDKCTGEKKGEKFTKVTLDDAINKYHRKPCPKCYKSGKA